MMSKRLLLLYIFIFTTIASTAREVYNFNNDWSFSRSISINKYSENITLPHVWGVSGTNEGIDPLYKGTCYYLKEVMLPSSLAGKELYVRFNGVATVADIFINGKYVTEHKGAFTTFNVDITPFVRLGEYNSILVVVSNAPRMDVFPFSSDANIFGGIYSDVELIALDKNHISLAHYGSKGVYIDTKELTPSSATMQTTVMLTGRSNTVIAVSAEMLNKNGVSVGTQTQSVRLDSRGKGKAVIPISIDFPRLWAGVSNPYLYTAKITLKVAGRVTDNLMTSFGIREVEINDSNKLLLNGVVYPARGVNAMQDRSVVGSAYRDNDFKEDTDLMIEMGATAVRTASAPHSAKAYSNYDKAGLIAWVDLPLSSDATYAGKGFADNFSLKENGRQQLYEMIYQLYNHPSICFWGIFNEISSTGDDPLGYIRELNNIAQTHSPGRITIGSSIEDGDINHVTEAISWPVYFGWNRGEIYDFEIWIKQVRVKFRSLKSAISEYGAKADTRTVVESTTRVVKQHESVEGYPQTSQSLFHERYFKVLEQNPYFWGTFINSMFDYSNGHMRDGLSAGFSTMGLVSYDRYTKKDAFYFYKANWNDNDYFIHISDKNNKRRSSTYQTIKAYTNLPTATLTVNGKMIGASTNVRGVVEWNSVSLKRGKNSIVVSSDGYNDSVELEIYNKLLAQ